MIGVDFAHWFSRAGFFRHPSSDTSTELQQSVDLGATGIKRKAEQHSVQTTVHSDKRLKRGVDAENLEKSYVAISTTSMESHTEQLADDSVKNTAERYELASDNAKPTPMRPICFFDLPPELRLMVYAEALPAHQNTSKVPELLRCSLQICQEASPLCTRVLSVDFFGGLYCEYPSDKVQTQRFVLIADRIKRASSSGIPVLLRVEVRCGGAFGWGAILKPLIDIIHETPTLQIHVLLHQSVCVACTDRGSTGSQQRGVRLVKDLVDRVISDRDCGFVRTAAYLSRQTDSR